LLNEQTIIVDEKWPQIDLPITFELEKGKQKILGANKTGKRLQKKNFGFFNNWRRSMKLA